MILTILDSTGSTQGPNERRKYLQIGLLALALLLVAVLGFRQVQRWMTPTQEVWVASADLSPGATVSSRNLTKSRVAESALPKGALLDARAIAGRELSRAKAEGEPFVASDFASGGGAPAASITEMVPEGRVLTTIRVSKWLVPYRNLKSGDRVDVATVVGQGAARSARVIARDAYVVGAMMAADARPQALPQPGSLAALVASASAQQAGGKVPTTFGLVLAVHPEHAMQLVEASAGRGALQVVLHGKAEVASGQLLELPEERPVEFIAGSKKIDLTVTP
jgi:Flp pilus assembly protein CpaB